MTATCPFCSDELDIPPAFAGRPVRCGSCQAVFTPPTFDAAPEWAEPEPRPRRRPPLEEPPRSSAGVWGLALLTLLVTGPCTAGCIGGLVVVLFPQFRPADDDAGRYKAVFPGPPSTVEKRDNSGRWVRGSELHRDIPQEHYFVYYVDLPKAAGRDAAAVLTEEADGLGELIAPGAAEVERAAATHDGFPALDVLLDDHDPQGGTVVVRCVLAGGAGGTPRLYVVGVSGPLRPDDTRAKRFFGGFRLTGGK